MTEPQEDVIAHYVCGDPEGVPILLVPPLGADHRFWSSFAECLGGGVRIVTCDLRGSGASPSPDGPLTPEVSVADLERLRRHVGAPKVVIGGCAVGAMVAATYAACHNERTLALIMSNPGMRIVAAAAQNLRMRADSVRTGGMRSLLPDAIDRAFFGQNDPQKRAEYESRFVAQDPEGYAQSALGACDIDIAPLLHTIDCPALIVSGGNDLLFPVAHANEAAQAVRHATWIELPEAAHFLPYQLPEVFADHVGRFLDSQGLRSNA